MSLKEGGDVIKCGASIFCKKIFWLISVNDIDKQNKTFDKNAISWINIYKLNNIMSDICFKIIQDKGCEESRCNKIREMW